MTKIIMVRHGQSMSNIAATFTGQLDAPLSPLGVKQAQLVKKYITENFSIDAVYSSDLSRAYDTALPTARYFGKEIIKTKALREIDGGLWQGETFDYIEKTYPEDYSVWHSDIGKAVCTGGESLAELAKRVSDFVFASAKENFGKTVMLATHTTPVRAFTAVCRFGDILRMKDTPWYPNASVSVFEYDGKNMIPVICGFSDHLSDLITELPDNC